MSRDFDEDRVEVTVPDRNSNWSLRFLLLLFFFLVGNYKFSQIQAYTLHSEVDAFH